MPISIIPSNVEGFKSFADLFGYGRLSPARYEIFFSNLSPQWNFRLNLAVESTAMPGRSIATATYKIAGPKREMPYELLYNNEIQMVFRVGEDMFEKLVFEDWMNRVAPYSNGFINYYNSYVQDITITQLDRADNEVMKVTLNECYPKIITDLDLSGLKNDESHSISVTFAYKDYTIIGYVPYVQQIRPPLLSGNPYQGDVSNLPFQA
jgi:hypothetical protein